MLTSAREQKLDAPFDCTGRSFPPSTIATTSLLNFSSFPPIIDATEATKSPGPGAERSKRRFVNMFTSQKFREWLKYEWLYSATDREIFLNSNDFQLILREHFPTLKTRYLRRGHWGIIRRMIGKPRRFSHTFLTEERESVQGKRRNLQYLQHIALTGLLGPMASEHFDNLLTCLPETTHIPLRLRAGTTVCVKLDIPSPGLFLGVIQDSFPSDGHYTVWIEGSLFSSGMTDPSATLAKSSAFIRSFRLVQDEDVLTIPGQTPPDSIPLSTLRYHFKENSLENTITSAPNYHVSAPYGNARLPENITVRPDYENSGNVCASYGPLLSENICTTECPSDAIGGPTEISVDELMIPHTRQSLGAERNCPLTDVGFHSVDHQQHAKLYTSLARLYKVLEQKCYSVETLREMNNVAEAKLSENRNGITVQFQHSYATLILHLDKLNQELKYHMDIVLMHVAMIAQESNMIHLNHITDWRRRCDDEAQEMVSRIKMTQHPSSLDEYKMDLVAKLSSLLIHLCNLSDQRFLNQSLVCIDDLLKEIRQQLHPNNLKCFEMTVEHFVGQIINAVTSTFPTRMQPVCHNVAPSQPPVQLPGAYTDNLTII
ncbi:unnamed protein product [Dicrocoelium dendriticum]|nr:unnamed protein product [Dicrocoelium dendriticum]